MATAARHPPTTPLQRRTLRWITGVLTLAVIATSILEFATCHRLPAWSGVIDVTPIERPALNACGLGRLTVSGSNHLMRAPYLQNVGHDRATLVFAAPPDPAYLVRVQKPDGEMVATARARFAGKQEREPSLRRRLQALKPQETVAAKDYYLQRADLQNLEPDTLYCYQLMGPGGAQMDPAPLITAPDPDDADAIEFVVLGDTGTGNAAARAIASRLSEVPFEFMLFLGDIAYTDGTAAQLDSNFFDVYERYLRYVPAFPALGNHEYNTRDGRYYLRDFVLPGNERYYSFDWGNAHFLVLDTTRLNQAQIDWVEQDLRATRAQWRIVAGHHPPFSHSRRGSNRKVRQLVPMFEHYGVDLMLSGHEHHYERFAAQSGIHFVVTGGGGGSLTAVSQSPDAIVQAEVHHFIAIEIEDSRLEARVIDVEGEEIDRFVIDQP